MPTALFPGSFDPFTVGHLALLRRAFRLFDRVIIAVGVNTDKHCSLPVEERISRIRQAIEGMAGAEVVQYDTLTTDFCHEVGATCIVRGLRNDADFHYESEIAEVNRMLAPDIETVFILTEPHYRAVSSSMVRQLQAFGKDVTPYLA